MNECKLDHADAATVPAFLCRGCHPELNATPEEARAADIAERKKAKQLAAIESRKRTIASLEREIYALSKAREGSVSWRIKMSQEKKLAQLKRAFDKLLLTAGKT